MSVFLCGGGAGRQTDEVNALYAGMIDKEKPVLYLPFAMTEDMFGGCEAWIPTELNPFGIRKIRTLTDIGDFPGDLTGFSSVYIGGGNTFRLLTILKQSGVFERLREYIANGGVVMGGSAGAIIFGRDISCSWYADENVTGLENTRGLDILNGWDICCHFTDRDAERNAYEYGVIADYAARGNKVLALTERTHLFVEDGRFTVVGPGECAVLEGCAVRTMAPGESGFYQVVGRDAHIAP